MPDSFIDHDFTQPTELRDFVEWHQGIKHYGFWAIEVTDPLCLKTIGLCQQHLADRLHPHYLRQPHITLSASGLIDEQHFSQDCLQQQIHALKTHKIKPFSLYLTEAHSFSSAPYLAIKDPSASLQSIRKCLHGICAGEEGSEYVPHVTLGFYKHAYPTPKICTQLSTASTLHCKEKQFKVNEIIFARYNTREIQGRYQVLHRIPLV